MENSQLIPLLIVITEYSSYVLKLASLAGYIKS